MSRQIITVVDYGLGNLFSVKRALEESGAKEVKISSSINDILKAEKLILPGVGAFADGMEELRKRDLISSIINYADSGRPLMGICLGMQMLGTKSEEFGEHNGLNLIPGLVRSLPNFTVEDTILKVPNVGWRPLHQSDLTNWSDSIFKNISPGSHVYFVHSYAFETISSMDLLAFTTYGGHKISAVIKRNNIYGCQFHPEKSGKIGLGILSNFIND